MKLALIILTCLLLPAYMLRAQDHWWPAVTFPANTGMCDDAPPKLVLYDDFDGSTLNNDNWDDYYSWNYMLNGGDNEDWEGARREGSGANDYTCINRSQNVVVSNGTCKLLIKHEPASWTCATCQSTTPASTKYYTAGVIITPYLNNDDGRNWFNSGIFEVKAKLPTAPGTHFNMWTWYGSPWDGTTAGAGNEIDIIETSGLLSTGVPDHLNSGFFPDPAHAHGFYFLHGWGPPDGTINNPYHLLSDNHSNYAYPNQTWINMFLTHDYLNIADWHTYRCEWDTAVIRMYLDGSPVNTIWKYYKTSTHHYWWDFFHHLDYTITTGSDCNASGTYHITYGYPWNSTNSLCNFRITTSMYDPGTPTSTSTLVDQAEIDYVAIYQRHPEEDNHTDICGTPANTPVINAPTSPSSYHYTFTVTNPIAGATWSHSNNLEVVSSSNSSITVHFTGPESGLCFLNYIYGNASPGCPVQYASRSLYVQTPFHVQSPLAVMSASVPGTNYNQFSFASIDPTPDLGKHNADAQYYWTIKYNLGSDTIVRLQTYTTKGKYASMPYVQMPANGQYYLDWTLKIVTPYDSAVFSGTRNSKTPLYRQKSDSALWYFNAAVTDTAAYDATIYNRVAGTMVGEDADSIDILSMINQVRLQELEPYLIIDTTQMQTMVASKTIDPVLTDTRIYPNPANNQLNIEPGRAFVSGAAIFINIYDINGHSVQRQPVNYAAGMSCSMDISRLPAGVYFLELIQNKTVERQKIVKQ